MNVHDCIDWDAVVDFSDVVVAMGRDWGQLLTRGGMVALWW